MIKRFAPWATVMSLMMTLLLPDLPQISQGREADTPAQETENCTATSIPGGDEPVDRDVSDACDTPAPNDTGVLQRDGEAQNDNANPCADGERENCPEPSTASTDQNDNADRDGDGTSDRDDNCPDSFNQELTAADADGAGDTCDADAAQRSNNVSNENQHLVQAAESPPPTVVEVYCDIPDVNSPDQRIVGTYVDSRSGYGDPIVTFTLHDLNGNVINATGSSPMPSSNPITASPPYPNNWEWGPGGYSQLTVSAVYPSLAPASYPDASSSVKISCVPDAPTPTPPPAPTTDPLVTPPPTPTPASYIPTFTTEMKDTAGNTILDGATVSPGTGIYDIATISGIPPGTAGTVLYQLFRGNCSVYLGLVGNGHNVVADVNGVAVAPSSSVFTVPGIPGGFYDWRIIYLDASTGSVYSGCGLETFYVPPPLPSSGTGSARLTCFVREPAEPGRAGYKVNVSPLPATGSVEVNVTLLLGENLFEYATVTLPPGTAQDLEFYGAYTFAWVNVVYRDAAGEIYAVVNLEGACAATPGPTPTPGPTQTVTPIATTTPTPPATSTPTSTSTLTPSPTQTSTDVASSTPTPSATLAATSTMTPTTTPAAPTSTATNGPTVTLTNTPATTPAPTSESGEKSLPPDPTPGVTGLPTTGSGDNHSNEKSLLLFATLCAIAAVLLVTSRMEIRRGGRPS